MTDSWKLTLPCTRAEAEAINLDALAAFDPPPVLMTSEQVVDDAEAWQLDAYFETKPGAALIRAVVALAPGGAGTKPPKPQRIAGEDWVTLSQSGIEPVHAGRFYVHTTANRGVVPPGTRAFLIEAGLAFGTGQHETTTGCLMMLDTVKRRGGRVDNLIDLGTGTGLLAFAGLHLWPRAYATATDIDPIAIDVTRENARLNGVGEGQRQGALALALADGTAHELVQRRASYDLVIANILAGPLIAMARDVAAIAAPGATIILAGLLTTQADAVARAYRRERCRVAGRIVLGDWTILRLRKRAFA